MITLVEIDLRLNEWGEWARDTGMRSLGYPCESVEHKHMFGSGPGGDNPQAEMVEQAICRLPTRMRKMLVARYVRRSPIEALARAIRRSRRTIHRDIRAAQLRVAGLLYGQDVERYLRAVHGS